jgi:gamma-glutamyltranspeptidase/glutathione hydrolase
MCKFFEKSKSNNKNIDINEFLKIKKESFFYRNKYCVDPTISTFSKKKFNQRKIKSRKFNNYLNNKVSGDTSTLVVIDKKGNAVSWVQSLFEEFGSGIVSPTTGVVFHNRLYLEKLFKKRNNYLRPNKRPFHTLCPTIVLKNNKCDLAIATPGDHGQPQTIYQILHHVYKNNLTIQNAINKPRIRHVSDKQILVEKNFYLKKTNLNIKKYNKPDRLFGGVTAIKRKNNNTLSRGADKRRNCF